MVGIWAIPAYTMQGVHAEIRTMFAQSARKYIVSSRMAQGEDDYANASSQEREDIEVRWLAQKEQMRGFYTWKQKEKGKDREASPAPPEHGQIITEQIIDNEPPKTGWLHTRHLSIDERKKLQEQKKAWKKRKAEAAATGGTFIDEAPPSTSGTDSTRDQDEDFEQAILTAVRETSRGDSTEDARIEQAIRSSVRALKSRSATVNSYASASTVASTLDSGYMTDIKRPPTNYDIKSPPALPPRTPDELMNITDEEYQALIEQAVQLSMAEHQQSGIRKRDTSGSEDDEDFKTALSRSQTEHSAEDQHDENYKKALQASEAEHRNSGNFNEEEELKKALQVSQTERTATGGDDDEELRRVLEESERAHKEDLARASSLRSEEDIVLEYVKKQSLAEEEYRKSQGKQKGVDETDDELRRALEESMQSWSGVGRGGGGGGGPSTF